MLRRNSGPESAVESGRKVRLLDEDDGSLVRRRINISTEDRGGPRPGICRLPVSATFMVQRIRRDCADAPSLSSRSYWKPSKSLDVEACCSSIVIRLSLYVITSREEIDQVTAASFKFFILVEKEREAGALSRALRAKLQSSKSFPVEQELSSRAGAFFV